MPLARVQHIYNHKSGLAADAVVNTWYFRSIATPVDDAPMDFVTIINDFYNQQYTPLTTSVVQFIATVQMATLRETYKVYDMDHAEPRTPVLVHTPPTPSPANSATAALPSEVAVCLSYKATAVSGSNPARSRGRFFLGPLNTSILSADASNSASRPLATARTAILECINRAADLAWTTYNWQWVGFSPTNNNTAMPSEDPDAWYRINECWMDDAFDTQRRRGVAPTSRIVKAIT